MVAGLTFYVWIVVYRLFYDGLIPRIFWFNKIPKGLALNEAHQNGKLIFKLLLTESTLNDGLKFNVYTDRISNYLSIEVEKLIQLLPNYKQISQDDRYGVVAEGFFKTEEQVNQFVAELNEARSALI